MLAKILAALLAAFTAIAFAAVDVNKATPSELDAIKGIGPGIAGKIVEERKKGSFKDWQELVDRVKGVGPANAAKFSAQGLTVNGAAFAGAPEKTAPASRKDDKRASRPEAAYPAAGASATAAGDASPAMSSDDRKAARKKEKADRKAAKAAAASEAGTTKADKGSTAMPAKDSKPAAPVAAPASAAVKK